MYSTYKIVVFEEIFCGISSKPLSEQSTVVSVQTHGEGHPLTKSLLSKVINTITVTDINMLLGVFVFLDYLDIVICNIQNIMSYKYTLLGQCQKNINFFVWGWETGERPDCTEYM